MDKSFHFWGKIPRRVTVFIHCAYKTFICDLQIFCPQCVCIFILLTLEQTFKFWLKSNLSLFSTVYHAWVLYPGFFAYPRSLRLSLKFSYKSSIVLGFTLRSMINLTEVCVGEGYGASRQCSKESASRMQEM